jgi:hypothetical protein
MKQIAVLTSILLLAAPLAARETSESRTIRETFDVSGSNQTAVLIVDNIFGSIRVTGHAASTIELVAEETITARSRDAFDRARAEVELEIRNADGELELYVDGPFRNHNRGHDDPGYQVEYDFEIRVPFECDLRLKTINDGEIRVAEVSGEFEVRNVNGGITMDHMRGSGDARTVNGSVRIRFDENPRRDSSFKTINGELEFSFQPGLSADLEFKTFNGEAWSDFEIEPLPLRLATERRRNGSLVIRTDSRSRVRAGRGGPQLSFDTLNGDIRIRNARGSGNS